tara:strand:- start:2555 stop:2692 length:138 start_codon:yes stop_codon:yes gene_type:complete
VINETDYSSKHSKFVDVDEEVDLSEEVDKKLNKRIKAKEMRNYLG